MSQPLKTELAEDQLVGKSLFPNKTEHSASGSLGKREGGGGYDLYWAVIEGEVDRSLPDLIHELLGHETTRSARATEMKIENISDSNFLARQHVTFGLHPFPFVHIEWSEDWGFSLVRGDALNPEKVWVTYQKESGTGYIQRLCGQFELTRLGSGGPHARSTIRIYEEAAAKGRTEQDTLSGITTTLQKLRSTK